MNAAVVGKGTKEALPDRDGANRKYQIEYLVFSSHKTATQSLVASLNRSGIRSLHCHIPENIGLQPGEFIRYLEKYQQLRGKRLKVISVFREPVERLISSFFQWNGIGAVRGPEGIDHGASIISRLGFEELQEEFYDYCNTKDGFGESLLHISEELSVNVKDFCFLEKELYGNSMLDHCELYLFRFDLLIKNFSSLLERVIERPVVQAKSNLGDEQWYASRYRDFKKSVVIPSTLIERIYHSRQELIDLFYPSKLEQMLDSSIRKYAPKR